jgi:Spy/CpxP family protein refolding chaperone
MTMNRLLIAAAVLASSAVPLLAQHTHGGHGPAAAGPAAPYTGQDKRAIKSLSPADIEQLRTGAGWGFAKPAELSGYPGPRHVLDLAEELALTTDQRTRIQEIFDGMNAAARKTGAAFIDAERALSEAFATSNIAGEELGRLVLRAGKLRAALRLIHLEAHLLTRPILTSHQLEMYDKLRGYGGGHKGHGGHGGQHHRHGG